MKLHPLTAKIIFTFESNLEDELAIGMKKYMRDKFDYLGIKSPTRAELLKPFFPEFKKLDEKEWMLVV